MTYNDLKNDMADWRTISTGRVDELSGNRWEEKQEQVWNETKAQKTKMTEGI